MEGCSIVALFARALVDSLEVEEGGHSSPVGLPPDSVNKDELAEVEVVAEVEGVSDFGVVVALPDEREDKLGVQAHASLGSVLRELVQRVEIDELVFEAVDYVLFVRLNPPEHEVGNRVVAFRADRHDNPWQFLL